MPNRILSPEHISAHQPSLYVEEFEWAPSYDVALATTAFEGEGEEPQVTVLMLDRVDAERLHRELTLLLHGGG